MTQEKFTAYLQDESHLYTLSYEELRTLVINYPFAANLRLLLLKKSFLENNRNYDRDLQMAATYTTDRRHLYRLIKRLKSKPPTQPAFILGEDFLELTELSKIEKQLTKAPITDIFNTQQTDIALDMQWVAESGDAPNDTTPPEVEAISSVSDITLPPSEPTQQIDSLIDTIVSQYLHPKETESKSETAEIDAVENTITSVEQETNAQEIFIEGGVEANENDINTEPLALETIAITDSLTIEDLDTPDPDAEIEALRQAAREQLKATPEHLELIDFDDFIELNSFNVNTPEPLDADNIIENELIEIKPDEALVNWVADENDTIEYPLSNEAIQSAPEVSIEIVNPEKTILKQTEPVVSDTPKPSFSEWLKQFKTGGKMPHPIAIEPEPVVQPDTLSLIPDADSLSLETPATAKMESLTEGGGSNPNTHEQELTKKKKRKKEMHELAARSNELDPDIASETLAQLYANQGEIHLAIKMYARLILKYPEKSLFFATQIEKLRNSSD